MRSLVLTLVLLSLGCSKTEVKEKLCDTGKMAATVLATQISSELACSNVEAVKASIEEKLVTLKICEVKPVEVKSSFLTKSAIGEALCAPVVEGLFAGGLTQLPKEWGCTGGDLAAEAKARLIQACSKAF